MDPHTGYRLESQNHSHASSGIEGGQLFGTVLVWSGLTTGHVLTAQSASTAAFAAPAAAGGGTLFLTGTINPVPEIGKVGDIYVNTETDTMFGPKQQTGGFGAAEVILTGIPSITPSSTGDYGNKFSSSIDGRMTGFRYYRVTGATWTPVVFTLWSIAGAQLAQVSGAPTGVGFNTFPLATPYPIVAGTQYVVSYGIPGQPYSRNDGTLPIVGAHVTLLEGRWSASVGAFPGNGVGGMNIWVEPVFEPVAAIAWPVLLKGVAGAMRIEPPPDEITALPGTPPPEPEPK